MKSILLLKWIWIKSNSNYLLKTEEIITTPAIQKTTLKYFNLKEIKRFFRTAIWPCPAQLCFCHCVFVRRLQTKSCSHWLRRSGIHFLSTKQMADILSEGQTFQVLIKWFFFYNMAQIKDLKKYGNREQKVKPYWHKHMQCILTKRFHWCEPIKLIHSPYFINISILAVLGSTWCKFFMNSFEMGKINSWKKKGPRLYVRVQGLQK